MRFELEPLPYPTSALEPFIGARTVEIHFRKHHGGYLEKLRAAIEGRPVADQPLEEVVRVAEGNVFNNAAQVWNHAFYWKCMRAPGGEAPRGEVREALDRAFGSVQAFKRELAEVANHLFGSGWAWLVREVDGRLAVRGTPDAENPLCGGATPILALDVWEHAYYLDYQNERARYVEGFLESLVNWQFVGRNLLESA